MRLLWMILAPTVLLAVFSGCAKNTEVDAALNTDTISFVQETSSPFRLSYVTAGLGSNMGALMPNFVVEGQKFTYVLSQNSSLSGKYDKPSEKLCEGSMRQSSIDSIVALISFLPDSEYYNSNIHIMSGVYQTLTINTERKSVKFTMHNGYDSTAAQIITVLNSNLPDSARLYVFGSHNPPSDQ